MEDNQKRNMAFALLIAFLILSSIFFFIFQNFLNKGTLIILEESSTKAPFTVFERKTGETLCQSLPCKIKVFAGNKEFLFQKPGFKDTYITTKVSFLKTTNLSLQMELKPYLESSSLVMPSIANPYRLVLDASTGIQKLVDITSPLEQTIAFFPNEIENPRFFLSKNSLLILDINSKAILVNTKSGEKLYIDSVFDNAGEIVVSNDAKFFAFENKDSKTINIYSSQEKLLYDTEIISQNTKFVFSSDNQFFFVKSDWSKGDYPFFVGTYDIQNLLVSKVYEGPEITERIEQIFLTESAADLYIKSEGKVFRLLMDMF